MSSIAKKEMERFEILEADRFFCLGYNADSHVLLMKFIGEMTDEEYKHIWKQAFKHTYEKGIEKLIIDQSMIGNVSFSARAWVLVKMFPKIKRDLSPHITGAIVSSANILHRSGVHYLAKAFQKVSGYHIQFIDNYDLAIEWLNETESKRKIATA